MNTHNLYLDKGQKYWTNDRKEMLRYIPKDALRVLDIGCGSGGFGASLKNILDCEIVGVEINEQAAELAKYKLDDVIRVEIDQLSTTNVNGKFGCIVFNDVLEHLIDPWSALANVKQFLEPSGVVVASIPNLLHHSVIKPLILKGEWKYTEYGILDRTHLRFFTKSSIQELFSTAGYRILTIEGINHERLPWKFGLLNLILLDFFHETAFRQYAVVAQTN